MKILYDDEYMLACVKPAGVLSTDEEGGVPSLLRTMPEYSDCKLHTVHRLDRVVGGAMLLAKDRELAAALGKIIEEGKLYKEYLAIVHGAPEENSGSFTDLLCRDREEKITRVVQTPGKNVQEAKLEYRVLETLGGISLVKIKLITGRTHQIRCQFSHHGLPLVGDRKYGSFEDPCETALWSGTVGITHPVTGEYISVSAAPPAVWPWTLFNIKTEKYDVPAPRSYPLPCAVKEKCGGCQLQRMTYPEQIKWKQAKIKAILGEFGHIEPLIYMPEPYHYRNKVQAAFGLDKKGNIISGVYQSSSHRIVPIDSCLLEDSVADGILRDIREMLPRFKVKAYDERTGTGQLRHVLIKRSFTTGQVMVVLVVASVPFKPQKPFAAELIRRHPEIKTVVLNINGGFTSMVLGEREQVIYGPGYIEDILCGMRFRISPASFYQINTVLTETLYRTAVSFAGLTGKENVLDAYCGTGTIGLAASGKAAWVTGIEINRDAVANAKVNAKINGRTNCSFIAGDAGKVMTAMAADGARFDAVFMDPPRAGSDKKFITALLNANPGKIVYISCNPETLARDLRLLTEGGYAVRKIQPVDMFPHTEHVETVCLLSKLSTAKHHVEVTLNTDEMDLTSAESKATYQEIKDYIFEKHGVKVSSLYIAQIKEKNGIIERDCYNKPKSEDFRQPQCPSEKEGLIVEALKHFQMI